MSEEEEVPQYVPRLFSPLLIRYHLISRLIQLSEEDTTLNNETNAGPSRSSPKLDKYDRRKVPLTILTGYLGAGKSTLLEYVLALPTNVLKAEVEVIY